MRARTASSPCSIFVAGGDSARVERVRYVPVFVSQPDFTVLPVGAALESGPADEAALRASYERTVDIVGRDARTRPIPPKLAVSRRSS